MQLNQKARPLFQTFGCASATRHTPMYVSSHERTHCNMQTEHDSKYTVVIDVLQRINNDFPRSTRLEVEDNQ
jgi:hypothetical protein